jgi:probable rRNA maturation factor
MMPEKESNMIKPEVNVTIEPRLDLSIDENWLIKVAVKTFATQGIDTAVEIGLVITDDKTIQELNRTYRRINSSTDVLAFHMASHTSQESKVPFVSPPDGIRHLGEVVISYPQAIKQAHEQGHGTTEELTVLTIHGVLHLLGYDHGSADAAQQMRAREKEILEDLALPE